MGGATASADLFTVALPALWSPVALGHAATSTSVMIHCAHEPSSLPGHPTYDERPLVSGPLVTAGIIDLLSNQDEDDVTVDRLRKIGHFTRGDATEGDVRPKLPTRPPQCLSKRLSADQIDDAVRRYREGESARSIAMDIGVAPSALVRLLREKGVTVQKTRVTAEQARQMAKEYEAGSTMREIEARYGLSHGAVYRALHQVGFEPRSQAPRPQS